MSPQLRLIVNKYDPCTTLCHFQSCLHARWSTSDHGRVRMDPGMLILRRTRAWRWRDPKTGYVRCQVSPSAAPIELVRVELPARRSVSFPASAYAFVRQLIWVLDGCLTFREGEETHELDPGDCLVLGPPRDCTFKNAGARPCVYLIALVRQ